MLYESDHLQHFGIKGQKWGERRYRNEDGTLTEEGKKRYQKTLNKEVKKDVKEFAEAKAYYGEGAGIRRKQIKNMISEKMKDERYKQAFDKALENYNMEKAQKTANRQRSFKDFEDKAAKSINKVTRFLDTYVTPIAATAMSAVIINAGSKFIRSRFG